MLLTETVRSLLKNKKQREENRKCLKSVIEIHAPRSWMLFHEMQEFGSYR